MADRPQQILFVCTGNTCRSPMAVRLFERELSSSGSSFRVRSAGVSAVPGSPASSGAIDVMGEIGLDLSEHRTERVSGGVIDQSLLVVCMTRAHLAQLRRERPDAADRYYLLGEFLNADEAGSDVPDPAGMPLEDYRRVRGLLERAMPALARFVMGLTQKSKLSGDGASAGVRTRVALGADHGGVALRRELLRRIEQSGHEVIDFGTDTPESVDYPDFAEKVAREVASGHARFGVLICKTGIGMSIASNRIRGVRAALCSDVESARIARHHNDANVLSLAGSRLDATTAGEILTTFLETEFDGGRHLRRIRKIETAAARGNSVLARTDPRASAILWREWERQQSTIELIASENFASPAVLEAQGSILTNKYAEGYPRRRWYDGCEHVDEAEDLAIERALELFGAEHANVQPHSGSQANLAAYFALLDPGDTVLGMDLAHGGHLTHGLKANFSGRLFKFAFYGVDSESERVDYDEVARLARETRPKLLLAGASAYPRILDFERFAAIARSVDAFFMVDMAHIAGLVAAGLHPSPVPHADIVTTTTHKTLRGPRGGLILCRRQHAKQVDRQIFPGTQGGPLMHIIAAKAVCFGEALAPAFRAYQARVVENAVGLASELAAHGYRIVSGGTDNHLMLVDLTPKGITGKEAATALDRAGITANKNAIPFDPNPPSVASGIRLGTPAVTTRGMGAEEMKRIAELIDAAVTHRDDEDGLRRIRERSAELCARFPLAYSGPSSGL